MLPVSNASSTFISRVEIYCPVTSATKTLEFDNVYDIADDGLTLIPRTGVTIREFSIDYPVDDYYDTLRSCLPEPARSLTESGLEVRAYDQYGKRMNANEVRVHFDDLGLYVDEHEILYGLDPHNPVM